MVNFKNPCENSSSPLQDIVSPWKPEEISKHVADLPNSTPPDAMNE